ncbi:MFS transporter [Sandaracinobacteroides saxicola]|uniref:MFS transporter n=1 Tax=Sandaracinobacteroides saxicola TaxID=2759707 RepID=A0A7G5IIW9_9SPHN|nr:MFS transporter [Sandaracinobacteroides saxicola]QMW23311.1 MFS transporter [Sandaracinobacteroides saxicola]
MTASRRPAVMAMLAACLFYAAFGGLIQWFPIWLIEVKDITGEQLGLLISLAGAARIVSGPLFGAWADGRRDRRAPIRMLAALTLLAMAGLVVSEIYAVNFALAMMAEVTFWALIAFLESALLRLTRPDRFPTYGLARGLASLSFVVGNIACGMLVDWGGNGTIWWWMTLLIAALLASAFMMSAEPVERGDEPPFGVRLREGLAMVRRTEFALLMFGCGIIQAAHQFYYIFGTKLWIDELGISATTAGWVFALGATAEALFLMLVARHLEHVRPATLMVIGGVGAMLRWSLMATGPELPLLLALQLLHAASFACTFLGAMRGIQAMWGDDRTPTAQMIFMALATAPSQAVASYLAGAAFERGGGPVGYAVMAGVAMVGTLLVLWLRVRVGRAVAA